MSFVISNLLTTYPSYVQGGGGVFQLQPAVGRAVSMSPAAAAAAALPPLLGATAAAAALGAPPAAAALGEPAAAPTAATAEAVAPAIQQ